MNDTFILFWKEKLKQQVQNTRSTTKKKEYNEKGYNFLVYNTNLDISYNNNTKTKKLQ